MSSKLSKLAERPYYKSANLQNGRMEYCYISWMNLPKGLIIAICAVTILLIGFVVYQWMAEITINIGNYIVVALIFYACALLGTVLNFNVSRLMLYASCFISFEIIAFYSLTKIGINANSDLGILYYAAWGALLLISILFAGFLIHFRRDASYGAIFSESDFRGTNFNGSYMGWTKLRNSNFAECTFNDVNLHHANVYKCDLTNSQLTSTNLRYALIKDSTLTAANLNKADLQSSILSRVDLSHTDLRNANLKSVTLHHVSLHGANLDNAEIERAKFINSTYDGNTVWPAGFEPTAVKGLVTSMPS